MKPKRTVHNLQQAIASLPADKSPGRSQLELPSLDPYEFDVDPDQVLRHLQCRVGSRPTSSFPEMKSHGSL